MPDFIDVTFLCNARFQTYLNIIFWFVMDLLILKTRNYWAGEGQQEFN
jgi:hypothetical protein